MILTQEQKEGIKSASAILKGVFPKDNLQICFNISKGFDNANFNIKMSEILRKND